MSTGIKDAGEFFGTSTPDDGLVEAEIALDRFWQCQFLGPGPRAFKPATLVRRAPKMCIFLSSRRTSPFVFDRTQNKQALHVAEEPYCPQGGYCLGGGGAARQNGQVRANFNGSIPCHLELVRGRICDEEDDRSWIRSGVIRSGASNRARHARSGRRPRELFASLRERCRVSCRIQRLRGESALCPSCGAPHRSPDIPPPPLLTREDDGRRSVAGHKRVLSYQVAAGKSLQPPLQQNALLASTRLPGKMRNIFSLKAWVAPIDADILRL